MTAADGPVGEKRLRRKAKTEVEGSETRAGGGQNRLRRVATVGSDGGDPRGGAALGSRRKAGGSKATAGGVRLRRGRFIVTKAVRAPGGNDGES